MINMNEIARRRKEELMKKMNRITQIVRKLGYVTYEEIAFHLLGYKGYSDSSIRKMAKWIDKTFMDIKVVKGGLELSPTKKALADSQKANKEAIKQGEQRVKKMQDRHKTRMSRVKRNERFMNVKTKERTQT